MKRYIAILGTLLIVGIFLSGSASAITWHYVDHVENVYQCTNPDYAVGAPDGNHATIGVNGPPPKLGAIILDLGWGNGVPAGHNFVVFASSAISEEYEVAVIEESEPPFPDTGIPVGTGEDVTNYFFTTPYKPGISWRYIHIIGLSGSINQSDPIYGPEIDAVGWYEWP